MLLSVGRQLRDEVIGNKIVAIIRFVVQGYAMDGKVDAVCTIVDCHANLEGVARFFLNGYASPEFLENQS